MSIDNVQDITPRVQYVATAGQTEFPYPFPIFDEDDLRVYVDGTLQTKTTDYTVSGVGNDNGGTVTFTSALSGDEVVTIYRETEIARTTDFQQNGPWRSTSTNDELDRITVILQELKAEIGRCLRFPKIATVASDAIELGPIANWLDRYIYINSSGQPEPAVISETTVTQSIIGSLLYPQTQAESAAGVTPVNYAYPVAPVIDARRYLSGTDYATAIQSAIDVAKVYGAISGTAKGATVYLDPSVDWNCGTTTLKVYDGVWLEGGANNATRITWESGVTNGIESGTRTTARIFRGGLRKLTLWGPSKASGSVGMDFLRIDQWTLEDVWCINWDTGYKFDGTGSAGYRNHVLRGNVEFNNTGILIADNANEQHFHCVKITNNTNYGADVVDGDSVTFFDCNWESNGVHIRTAYQWTRVLFGRMEDATTGVMWETTSTAQHFHIMGVYHAEGSGSQSYTDAGQFTVNLDTNKISRGQNMVRNGSFEVWSTGTTAAPDAWLLVTTTVARESSQVLEGAYSAKLTASATNSLIFQDIPITGLYRRAKTRFLCCVFGRLDTSTQWRFAAIPQESSGGTTTGTVYDDEWRSVASNPGKTYTTTGTWTYAFQIVEPSPTANRIRFCIFPDSLDGDGSMYVDAAMCLPMDSNDEVFFEHARDLAPGLDRILVRTATLDFGSTDPADLTVTVPGAAVNDGVLVTPPAFTAGADFQARVSAADTVTVRKVGTGDPASGTYTIVVFKRT